MINAPLDENSRQGLYGLSSANDGSHVDIWVNPVTHAVLTDVTSGGGGTGTWWKVNGTIDGMNSTFTVATGAMSDFLLVLARQPQMQNVGANTWDYSYSVAGGTTTIVYTVAPDISLVGQPHIAFIIS